MRHLVVLVLVASPVVASAQVGEEPERVELAFIPEHLQQRVPGHRHAASEPESKFSLEYQEQRSPEEAHAYRRLHQARKGFYGWATAGGAFIGVGAMLLGLSYYCIGDCEQPASPGLFNAGLILMGVGAAAMIASGAVYGVRRRQLRELKQAHYGKPRRVQWDLASALLVF